MTKRILATLGIFLLCVGIDYFSFALIAWTFNPGDWHWGWRLMMALGVVIACPISVTFFGMYHAILKANKP